MRREKITFFKILFTVGILVSLPLTLILTNSEGQKADIRSKATLDRPSVPSKIIFLPFSFSKNKGDQVRLNFTQKAQIRNGFVPAQTGNAHPFTAKILDKEGGEVASPQKFSLPELNQIETQVYGIILPYKETASFVEIINPEGITVEIVSIQNATTTDSITLPTSAPTVTPSISPTPFSNRMSSSSTRFSTRHEAPTLTPIQIQRCSFPNFCTGPDFCETENILPRSCDSTHVVCCKFKEPQDNFIPSPTQRYEPSPTSSLPTITPTPLSSPTPSPTPFISSTPITTQFLSPEIETVLPGATKKLDQPYPSPTLTMRVTITSFPVIPSPTTVERYLIYETPTPYQVENIVFERPAPTPRPKIGILEILTAPSRFANNLISNFFSFIKGE